MLFFQKKFAFLRKRTWQKKKIVEKAKQKLLLENSKYFLKKEKKIVLKAYFCEKVSSPPPCWLQA